tara:strand:- start:3189 stop:3572 length:384 start_codon:yes stop_codon:yes gene_type:complete
MAFVITITFDYTINDSLQVGDNVYHSSPSQSGGFNVVNNTGDITHIGIVYNILSPYKIEVYSEYTDPGGNPLPGITPNESSYISFSKNRVVNNSDLPGYYSLVKLKNNSDEKIEMFSVGTNIGESSK